MQLRQVEFIKFLNWGSGITSIFRSTLKKPKGHFFIHLVSVKKKIRAPYPSWILESLETIFFPAQKQYNEAYMQIILPCTDTAQFMKRTWNSSCGNSWQCIMIYVLNQGFLCISQGTTQLKSYKKLRPRKCNICDAIKQNESELANINL